MRIFFGELAVVVIVLRALPALAGGDVSIVDGWSRARSEELCTTTYPGTYPVPSLILDLYKGGKARMSVMGLPMPSTTGGLQLPYSAVVTVKLNGRTIFAKEIMQGPGSLIVDVGLDQLRSMTDPGQIVFDIKGNEGQHDAIEYSSPGLESEVAFLSDCFKK